jgi:hypothetical protein
MGGKRTVLRPAGPAATVAARWCRRALALAGAAVLAAGCSGAAPAGRHASASATPLPPDPRTAAALLRIATAFNRDYDTGDYAPVYARWDARSQAIISGAQYIRRHRVCPAPPHQASVTESAVPGPGGAWLVHYEIGGQQLTDYWFYVHRRWVFDLVLSNPEAVRLYRMPARRYAEAVGCAHG